MLLANLPSHERKLYQLAFALLAVTWLLGLLIAGISAGENAISRADNWQASERRAGADTLADFNAVTAQSHWFLEGGQSKPAVNSVDLDEPESFRLLGVIDKSGQRHALFMPPATEVGRSKLVQLSVGDQLVGDWKVVEINSTKVKVASVSDEVRELLLYGVPAKVEKAPLAKHKAAAAQNTGTKPGAIKAKAQAQDKAKPKKDKAEQERARAERTEQRAKAKAAAAKQKAEKDHPAKHKAP